MSASFTSLIPDIVLFICSINKLFICCKVKNFSFIRLLKSGKNVFKLQIQKISFFLCIVRFPAFIGIYAKCARTFFHFLFPYYLHVFNRVMNIVCIFVHI